MLQQAKHTSVTLALDPGEVSTLAGVPVHRAASPQSFNFADLPCPPQSLIDIQNADRGAYILPILPQYAPIIVAPSKLLNLDPAWKHCAQDEFIAFDPPKALTPVSALLPGTTTRTPIMDPTPAAPNSAPNGLPKETGSTMTKMVSSVKNIDPTKDQARTSEFDPTASIQPTKTVDPPLPSGPDQKSDGSQSISANGMASNGGSFKSTSISSNVDPQNPQDPNKQSEDHLQHAPSSASVDPSTTLAVQPGPQGATNAPVVVVQGHTISETSLAVVVAGSPASHPSGFAYVGSNAAPTPMPTLQPDRTPDPVVIGGLSFTPVAKVRGTVTVPAVMVQGQTLWEDGPSATIGGNNVVYSAGFIHVGTYAAPAPSSAPQQLQQASAPQVVNGLTFSPTTAASAQSGAPPITVAVQTASSGSNFEVIIGNHTVLSDDSPITISGTPVSLGPAGLVVGKVTYTLPHSEGSGELPVATIDGQTIQFRPTGPIAVDGMSLSAGGPPITVSGIPISLGLSSLVIGTSVVPLPTTGNSGGLGEIILSGLGPVGPTPTSTSANSSNNVQNFTGSQAQVEIPSPAKLLFATAFLVALSIFM